MLNYKELNLLGDSELNRLNSVKLVIKNIMTNESYLLYFISPEVDTKGSIIRSILGKYEHDIPKELLKKLKLIALAFNAEDLLEDNFSKFDENQLVEVYAYFAKFKNIPQWVLQRLLEEVKEKNNSSRLIFLINILLSSYYLHNNNFDLAESHIKYCIEYINYNDYGTMSALLWVTIKQRLNISKKTINVSEELKNFSILESIKLKNTLGYIYYLKGNFSGALEIHL